ncbi:MAG: DUF4294 domain-containing protein [Bacteroidetes bacterium]|nr:DUF4294 domain-containing protein [Bacteroidota bacterium]
MKKLVIILSLAFLFPGFLFSQNSKRIPLYTVQFEGKEIPEAWIPEVWVVEKRLFKSKREEKKYNKLVRNVKKAYPYSIICQIKVREYNDQLLKISSEGEKSKVMKIAEKDIKKQFEKDVKDLTFSQGKVLIKLIDRQTGSTTYSILKDFRGTINAVLWQSLGRIFGYNLKDEYDALGDDKEIENIVFLIENGVI